MKINLEKADDLWAQVEVEADLFWVQVLIDQQVNDNGKLFSNKVLAGLFKTGQQVTEGVQEVFNLKQEHKFRFDICL